MSALCFGPYHLAGPKGPLMRDHEEIVLRSKTLQVLWYLVQHAGEVVEPGQLFAAVWPRTVVSVGVLAVSIRELRRALSDDPKSPTYIRTVHRHGYRFIAPVTQRSPVGTPAPAPDWAPLLGRDAELRLLDECYECVRAGERQVVLVMGEAGIGKSTLVDAWVRGLRQREDIWFGRGQCIEHSGAGEAYLGLLEALRRLCRGPSGEPVVEHLRLQAPGWLTQLSGVLTLPEREALAHRQAPVSAQHYQRELADALESLGTVRPVVLVLEDLQWCDQATVEVLWVLARRPEPARLLVIGTDRSVGSIAQGHPLRSLRQELAWHGQGRELVLGPLSREAVGAYVARHLPPETAEPVAAVVFQRTAGQPLFMVNLTDYLAESPELAAARDAGELVHAAAALPSGLQQLIELQLDKLSETERQVLEAGSVAGVVFTATVVGAAVDLPATVVESVCDELARQEQLIVAKGAAEWPDGTLSESYAFRHGLYQEVLYRRIAMSRRMRLHRAIGERLEQGHGAEPAAVAVELSEHFERGRDHRRAVRYHRIAGETALERLAAQAARAHLSKGLDLIERLPQDVERVEEELRLQVRIGAAAMASEGFGSRAVAHAYGRAHALCRQFPNTPALQPVLCGLWNYFVTLADIAQARVLADELSGLVDQAGAADVLVSAHNAIGQTHLFAGEPASALAHIEATLATYDARQHRDLLRQYGEDPGVVCHMYTALVDWLLGFPERASQRIETGTRLAQGLEHPFGAAQMAWAALLIAQGRDDAAVVREQADILIALCEKEGIAIWLGGGRVLRGWALAMQGHASAGLEEIHRGINEWEATGAALIKPYYLALQAEAYRQSGQTAEAVAAVAEGLAVALRTGERWYLAELYRLRAELMRDQPQMAADGMEAELQQALAIAREQQARALELRAATSLARHFSEQGKPVAARELLAPVYAVFTEGLQTPDLRAAKVLLDRLA
jgi:DNA-binding winged helix-turn-helix (wHTH) protein/predicted ATPase/energy-coupling factor transporter ATP-binding protein EcfA2